MKKMIVVMMLLVPSLAFAAFTNGDQYCQDVIQTGSVPNAAAQAKNLNKWIKRKGGKTKLSAKDVTNQIKRYCQENPRNIDDEVTKHLMSMVDILVAADKY